MNKRQQTVRISIQWTGCGNTGKKSNEYRSSSKLYGQKR